MGFVLLLAAGSLVLAGILLFAIVRDARHPARATAGWALARGLPVDPAALGFAFEDLEVAGVRAWRLDGGDPCGVVTLVIHGWRRSRIDSLRRREPWLGASRSLWAIDLAGHGESPDGPTTLGATDAAGLVRFAQEILARPSGTGPAPRLLLVGHSMGAVVAIDLARRLDVRDLAGVVAFAPYDGLDEPLGNRLAARGLPCRALARVAAQLLGLIVGPQPGTRGALAQLAAGGCPLLVAAARDDRTVRAGHTESLATCAGVRTRMSTASSHDSLGADLHRGDDAPMAQACREFADAVRGPVRDRPAA